MIQKLDFLNKIDILATVSFYSFRWETNLNFFRSEILVKRPCFLPFLVHFWLRRHLPIYIWISWLRLNFLERRKKNVLKMPLTPINRNCNLSKSLANWRIFIRTRTLYCLKAVFLFQTLNLKALDAFKKTFLIMRDK